VRDLGTVTLDHKEPTAFIRRNGVPSIAMSIERETGANVMAIMDELRIAVTELNDGPLQRAGLVLDQMYDETVYINSPSIW